MSRLFRKFFFFILLAQLLATLTIGGTFWLKDHNRTPHPPFPPPPHFLPESPEWPAPPEAFLMEGHIPPPDGREGMPPPDRPFMPLIPVISAILASLIFAAILAWYFSKPIQHLRSAFKAAASGNFKPETTKIMGRRSDELADLSHDVDNMARQINTLMDGQQRLLHDVSHELRSPLARMQVLIGLARQQPDRAESIMERIERESFRMDALIDELLTLSRLEAGVDAPATESVDMDTLLADIVADAELEARAKQCHISLSQPTNATVSGNTEMLYRAIENVVRNAVKHTRTNSTVTIESGTEQQWLYITVSDCGPGIPNNTLDAIFKPFYRVKNSTVHNEGYGIGLAIAHQVIKTYGGVIKAANRTEGGLQIQIRLPVKSDADH